MTNTIGIVRLACCKSPTIELAVPTSTSGPKATNSAAYRRKRSVSPAPNGCLSAHCDPLPSLIAAIPGQMPRTKPVQVNRSACSSAGRYERLAVCCCARAASGRRNAAPPSADTNCRLPMPVAICLPWGPARCNMGRISRLKMEVCDRLHGTPTAKRLTVFLRCEVTRLAPLPLARDSTRHSPGVLV